MLMLKCRVFSEMIKNEASSRKEMRSNAGRINPLPPNSPLCYPIPIEHSFYGDRHDHNPNNLSSL
jgi:hypothetical protein